MRSSRVAVALAAGLVLTGCQGGFLPAPTPSPTATIAPWEPLLAPEAAAGVGEIALVADEPFAGNFRFQLWMQGWEGDAGPLSTSFRQSSLGCTAAYSPSAVAASRAALADAEASASLLAEIATGTELESARRGVWLSDPAFDVMHTITETDDSVSYIAVRVFSALGTEHVVRLDCPSRERFRDVYATFRESGGVIASLTAAAPATADRIGPFHVRIPIDLGPGPHAMGTVALDADGHPARYTVAPDDEWGHIAARFGLSAVMPTEGIGVDGVNTYTGYLTTINSVRRGESPWTLYVGDTVNLSAFTVTSVGRINGSSTALPAPDPLPAQR
ncbi:hypothetical protein [Salinibacterium sp. ZJ70]|uniref:hypothetical protein n=1 Tax=Salinibacterium sp. ZJ70 TaxID=2708084 RepID=UPI00141EF34D|nr:hypothetical protein [Salinibacterium sp. ZJ70]